MARLDPHPGSLVAFRPGTPPRECGFYRGVVIAVDVPAVEALRRTAARLIELGQAAEAVLLELWAAECEARGVESRGVLVRAEAAAAAGIDFHIPDAVAGEWLDVASAAGPSAVN